MLARIITTMCISILLFTSQALAADRCEEHDCDNCCDKKGGIHYCDSSAGRYVCHNGDFSACYCTRRAVMDMQKFVGCCLWQGGVLKTTDKGFVVCRNGSFSEICSMRNGAHY